jgi:hypothetical protein
MSTLLIKTDNQSSKILSALAKKLGGNVMPINDAQLEDLLLGNLMDTVKTGKTVSKSSIMKKLKVK